MEPSIIELDAFVKSGRSDDYRRNEIAGVERMSLATISELPLLMGEIDLINSLSLLPGVSTVGEGSTGFNVRGGKIDQNLVMLNGGEIFNSSHLLGFFSIFNADVVEEFTLYKGHIPANFGGRIASVLDINLKEGDYQSWEGGVSAGFMSSKLFFEGPIVSEKISVIGSTRFAYPDWMMHKIPNDEVRQSKGLFDDQNLSIGFRFNDKNKIVISTYRSSDIFRYSNDFSFGWRTFLGNLRLQNVINENVFHEFEISQVHYNTDQSDLRLDYGINNGLNFSSLHDSFTYYGLSNHSFQGGLEIKKYQQLPEELIAGQASLTPNDEVKKGAGLISSIYANDDWSIGTRMTLSLGIRFNYFAQLGSQKQFQYLEGQPLAIQTITDTLADGGSSAIYFNPEPRVGLNLSVNPNWSLKASFNSISQYLHLISNSAAATPVDIWQVSTRYIKPQVSKNYSLGFTHQGAKKKWQHSFDLYYRNISRIYEYKDFAELILNPHLETELGESKGRSYGMEILIEKTSKGWTGWLSYTLAKSENKGISPFASEWINDGNWYPANYDQRHNLSLVLNKQLGRNGFFSLNVIYKSGRPFTAIEASYNSGGITVPVYADRNTYQIPDYFRVDLGIGLTTIIPKIEDRLSLSIYNFSGRSNAYSIFYQLPSAGAVFPASYKLSILGSMFPSITYSIKLYQQVNNYN